MTKKISLIFFFLFFIQYFIGHQSNMLAKGIKFYVGKFELSDMKISLRLTIEDNRNGTLNISKWIKSKGKKYKIEEFYFTSFEADTLILSGELLYDIKYLVKKQKRSCFIYPINSLPDGVLFCDENTKRIELIEKNIVTSNMFLTINLWASPMLSTDCILVFKLYALIVFIL